MDNGSWTMDHGPWPKGILEQVLLVSLDSDMDNEDKNMTFSSSLLLLLLILLLKFK